MKPHRRLAELMDLHLDHRLDTVGRYELELLLLEDAGCRREFWQRAEMEGLLQEWGRAQAGVEDHPCGVMEMPRPGWWRPRWLAGVAGLAAAVALAVTFWHHPDPPTLRPIANDVVAVLTHASEARWRAGSVIPEMGRFIGTGDLELETGWAVVEFVSGSELLIGGPAKVRIAAANEITCSAGSLTIHQPTPAASLLVRTPAGVIQDVYQTVALRVRPEATELLVERGRASLRAADGTSTPFPTGEALRISPGGRVEKVAGIKAGMTAQLRLGEQLRAASRTLPGHWLATSRHQNDHPDLLLRYTFDDIPPDLLRVPNQAVHSGGGLDGAIGGGVIREGRWPYKKAMEFDRRFDGIRVTVPGSYEAVTMAAWIQVFSYEHLFSGLLVSNGIKTGGFHWQLMSPGALHVGITDEVPGYPSYTSPPVLTPDTFGKWQHVAVVYDLPGNRVSHYLNGRLISRHELKRALPVQIRSAMLGNWDPLDDKDGDMIRNFNGRMDDFSIYQKALADDEIRQLYEQGRN